MKNLILACCLSATPMIAVAETDYVGLRDLANECSKLPEDVDRFVDVVLEHTEKMEEAAKAGVYKYIFSIPYPKDSTYGDFKFWFTSNRDKVNSKLKDIFGKSFTISAYYFAKDVQFTCKF